MSTLNPTLANTSFIGNNDFFWWLGTVQNADDRDARIGRVKVNILGFHKPEETPENLPWAIVSAPTDSAGVSGVGSAGNQMKPGSFVVGFFLDYPDCQQPVVLGTLLSKIKAVDEWGTVEYKDYVGTANSVVRNLDATNKGQSAESLFQGKVSTSVAAAAAPHSVSNPSGQVIDAPVADGKNAGASTLDANLAYAVRGIVTTLATLRSVSPDSETKLTKDHDKEEQTIYVDSTEGFPPIGVLDIDGELVGYNNKSERKFILAKRGFGGTDPKRHKKDTIVKLIPKSEYLGAKNVTNPKDGSDLMGTFSSTLVDIKATIDSYLEFIRDSLWWVVNQVKSFLMGEITKILNAIGIAAIFPSPMLGKILTDVFMYILNQIACLFDDTLLDSLFSIIESAINSVVDAILDILDGIQCILDAIFESIFTIIDIAEQIFDLVAELSGLFSAAGNITSFSSLSQLNITSVLDFIFGLLGIGCNKTTRDPFQLTFTSCPIASLLSCDSLIDVADFTASPVRGRWNPEYSKIIGTFSEVGTMIAMDDTPYNSRLIVEHGPSKSGIHIYDNGDVKITNSQTKTEVTIKDENIIVHGNVNMIVDGNYNLKVGKDYHLEVLGHYNLSVNRESKLSYYGEHASYFKNDAKLEANNGLALTASKFGVSASGQIEVHSPIYTRFTTETNEFNLGSKNLFTLYKNDFIGLNKVKFITGNNLESRIGTSFKQGIGLSNMMQLGIENEYWGGNHSQLGTGIWTENKLGIDAENTTGITSFTKSSAHFESIVGASFKNTTGIFSDNAQGIKFGTSAAIDFTAAPLVTLN